MKEKKCLGRSSARASVSQRRVESNTGVGATLSMVTKGRPSGAGGAISGGGGTLPSPLVAFIGLFEKESERQWVCVDVSHKLVPPPGSQRASPRQGSTPSRSPVLCSLCPFFWNDVTAYPSHPRDVQAAPLGVEKPEGTAGWGSLGVWTTANWDKRPWATDRVEPEACPATTLFPRRKFCGSLRGPFCNLLGRGGNLSVLNSGA